MTFNQFFLLVAVIIGYTVKPLIGQTPALYTKFVPPNGTSSQVGTSLLDTTDGNFRVDGPWVGTGSNTLEPYLAVFTTADPTTLGYPATGYLNLAISAGSPLYGSEIISNILPGTSPQFPNGLTYGYYETEMVVDPSQVSGGVCSFFLKEAGGTLQNRSYGNGEWDYEFLLNQPWVSSANSGSVQLTTHPSNTTYTQSMAFNPAKGYHRYGILWVPPGVNGAGANGAVSFVIDGQTVHTVTSADAIMPADGVWIMANAWSGTPSWGGGPPSAQVNCTYNWIKFWPNATSVPNEGQGPNPPTGLSATVH